MKIISVKAIKPYTIRVQYDDGIEGSYTIIPKSDRDTFHKLSDWNYMSQVTINNHHDGIIRDDENDIDGKYLHDILSQSTKHVSNH